MEALTNTIKTVYVSNKIRHVILRMVLGAAIGIGIWFVGDVIWYQLAPRAAFFSLHEVAVTDILAREGGFTLGILVDQTIRRTGMYVYRDELECKSKEHGWSPVAARVSTRIVRAAPRAVPPDLVLWPLPGGTFNQMVGLPTRCKLETFARIELPNGQFRRQATVSEIFNMP